MRQSYVNAGRYTAVDSILTPPSSVENELEFIDEFTFSLGDHDKNQEEVGSSISGSHAPAFGSRRNNPGDASSGRSEVQFKNISYQS